MIQAQLTEQERNHLIELHKSIISDVEVSIMKLTEKLNASKERIKELTNEVLVFDDAFIYDRTWPLTKKAEYVLGQAKEILNTRKIAELINKQEGGNMDGASLAELVNNLGPTLKQKVDKNVTFGRTIKHGEIRYGLKNWFDPNNVVKVEYDVKLKMFGAIHVPQPLRDDLPDIPKEQRTIK